MARIAGKSGYPRAVNTLICRQFRVSPPGPSERPADQREGVKAAQRRRLPPNAPRLGFRPTPAGRVPSWPGAPALGQDGCRGASGLACPHGRAGAFEPEGRHAWTADARDAQPEHVECRDARQFTARLVHRGRGSAPLARRVPDGSRPLSVAPRRPFHRPESACHAGATTRGSPSEAPTGGSQRATHRAESRSEMA
jgi:hypothetical protein